MTEESKKHNSSRAKERNEKIALLFSQGMTIIELGKRFNISKQRVSQILYGMGIESNQRRVEEHKAKEVENYKDKAIRYLKRARKYGTLYRKAHLRVMNLEQQLALKNKKLQQVENFTEVIKDLQLKIASLTNRLKTKERQLAKLEKERIEKAIQEIDKLLP